MHHPQELDPRQRIRILLAHVRENVVDVLAEHRIQCDKVHVLRPQRLALVVEQEGDALQKDRGLAASCNSVHQQDRHVRIPDDGVLFLLNGNRDGLHFVAVLAGERGDQHRILDGQLRVKIGLQLILFQVKLAAELQIHRDLPPVHLIGGAAVLLVVVRFGDGRAPVDDQLVVAVLRDRTPADVVVLRLLLGIKLELHTCKIRRLQQHFDLRQLLRHRAGFNIVGIDIAVPGLDLAVALGLYLIIRRVVSDIGQNIRLLLHSLLIQLRDALLQLLLHLAELLIGRMQVLLLLLKNLLIHKCIISFLAKRRVPAAKLLIPSKLI